MAVIDDLRASDWQDILARAEEKHCYEYRRIFLHKAREAQSEGSRWAQVYELISNITSLRVDLNEPRDPFRPESEMQGWRTFAAEDLSPDEVDALRTVAPDVLDAEMRARICDLCWTLDRRRHELGQSAISAYLESAVAMAVTHTPSLACDGVTRAVQIAALMGKRGQQYRQLVAQLQDLAERPDLPFMFIETVVEHLVEQRAGDSAKLREVAIDTAGRCGQANDYWRERSFWHLAERLSSRLNGYAEAIQMRRRMADSFVSEADALSRLDDPTTAAAIAHRLEHGLQTLRTVPGTDKEQAALHQRLLDSQRTQTAQMRTVSATTDLSDLIKLTREEFKGLTSVEDALFRLAFVARPPRVADLRNEVEEAARDYPLQHLFTRVSVDSDGRPIGKHAGVLAGEGDARQDALRAQMASHASLHRAITIAGGLLPAIDQINAEHEVRRRHIEQLVRATPFVPPEHRHAFATGLYAGYEGRMLECAHVLCPQIEAAVRHVLDTNGVITSKLSPNGTQERLNLNEMLEHEAATRIFGEDLVFDMQCLFVERFGANLRNNVAHGLLADEQFQSADVMYCWWLTLRLCCIPMIAAHGRGTSGDDSAAE